MKKKNLKKVKRALEQQSILFPIEIKDLLRRLKKA
jgi:hypothetical protein